MTNEHYLEGKENDLDKAHDMEKHNIDGEHNMDEEHDRDKEHDMDEHGMERLPSSKYKLSF